MMNEQVAGSMEEPVVFPESLSLDTPEVRGTFSSDASYTYQFDGPLLRVFGAGGESVSQYDFNKTVKGSSTEAPPNILCITEFNKANLVVGVEDGEGKGSLYLFNIVLCKILRAISIPQGVTSVETIHSNSDCNAVPYLSPELQVFSGLVACGTKQGNIYLLDMLLDHEVVSSPPLQLHCYDLSGATPTDRTELLKSEHKTSAYSLACLDNPQYFCYQSASLKILHYAQLDEVYVSSIKCIPQLGTLCVGYSFGSFQLWRLDPLTLDYSSPVDSQALPVHDFSYQEPENDPRSFCYLWAARCSGISSALALSDSMQEYVAGTMACVSMYQLAYDMKAYTDSGDVLFKDLMQVGCALEHQLAPDEDVVTSWVVSFNTLSNVKSIRCSEEDSQLDVMPTDTNMTVISWRVRYSDASVTSHFALFDINRWYHAQMPKQIRWYQGWCSYFSQYSFDDNLVGDKACLDLHINTDTLSCYKCPRLRKLERFQYPASLTFEVKLLLPDGVLTFLYNGLQRQALLDVANSGYEALKDPTNAFELLLSAGVIPNNTADQTRQIREILTTMILHTHTEYIVHCIWEATKTAGETDVVVTVRFIFEWLWERLENVIVSFDQACVPLYDWSGLPADTSCKQTLLSAITQTKNIISVLQHIALLKKRISAVNLDNVDMVERISIAETRLLHMRLVWWCVSRGLLPEVREEVTLSACFSYPATTLKRSYNNRHSQLLINKSVQEPELMIDIISHSLGSELSRMLQDEGGTGAYPPPNIKALVDVFLLEKPSLAAKLTYFVYTMLDLMALVDQTVNDSLSSHLSGLLSSASNTTDYSNLSTLVLAMWSLDHMEFQDLLVTLRQPESMCYISSSVAERMISTLLSHNQIDTALQAMSILSSQTAISSDILITTYLANKMLFSAVEVARTTDSHLETFKRILKTLKTTVEASELLCLPLSEQEMKCVTVYLGDKGDLDKLVVHLLQMGELTNAVKLNKKLNTQPLWRGNQKAKERAMTRDQLVRWQLSLLPPIQKKLLEDPNYLHMTRPKTTRPKVFRPGKSFFFVNKEARPIAPVEIAQVIMQSASQATDDETSEYKPFIQSLTPSVRKSVSRTGALSALKQRRKSAGGKSVTGLFDSPTIRSASKRSMRYSSSDEAPHNKSAKHSPSSNRTTEVKSILQTPSVRRKSPNIRINSTAPVATPHSILKIRKPLIRGSPSNVSQSPSLRFNLSTEKLLENASKSVSRVKFSEVQLQNDSSIASLEDEGQQEPPSPPKRISFDDEEPQLAEDIDRPDTPQSDSSEVEFNFGAPLASVNTAGHTAVTEDANTSVDAGTNTDPVESDDESFESVSSELSNPPNDNVDTPAAEESAATPPPPHQEEEEEEPDTDDDIIELEQFEATPSANLAVVISPPSHQVTSHQQTSMEMTRAVSSEESSEERPIRQTRSSRGSMAMEMTTVHHKHSVGNTSFMDMTMKPSTLAEKSPDHQQKSPSPEKESPKQTSMEMTQAVTVSSEESSEERPVRQTRSTRGSMAMEMTTVHHKHSVGNTSSMDITMKTATAKERSPVAQQITVSSDEEVFSSPTKASPLRTSSSPVKASPSPGHTASGASPRSAASVSPATSLKSLSNLDDEAQLSGLQLRQVREAEIQKAHDFVFSPVTEALGSGGHTLTTTTTDTFNFNPPIHAQKETKHYMVTTASDSMKITRTTQQERTTTTACTTVRTSQSTKKQNSPEKQDRAAAFYFSPAVPAAEPSAESTASISYTTNFVFDPPTPVPEEKPKTRGSGKPIRPIRIAMPTTRCNKNDKEDEEEDSGAATSSGGRSKKSNKPIKPFKFELPPFVETSNREETEQSAAESVKTAEVMETNPVSSKQDTESDILVTAKTSLESQSASDNTLPLRRSSRARKPSTADSLDETILAGNLPATTRRTTRTRKTSQSSDTAGTEVAPTTPTRRGRPKKVSQSSDTTGAETADLPQTPTRRGRPRKESQSSQPEEAVQPPPLTDLPTITEDVTMKPAEVEPKPTARRGRPRKGSTQSDTSEIGDTQTSTTKRTTRGRGGSEAEEIAEAPQTPTRRGRPRKGSQTTEKKASPEKKTTSTRKARAASAEPSTVKELSPRRSQSSKATSEVTGRRTRLRSAEPEAVSSTIIQLTMESPARISRSSSAKNSPTKVSIKIVSPKKSQSARKPDKKASSALKSRTTGKKPQLSPIYSSPPDEAPSGPRTRARRKL